MRSDEPFRQRWRPWIALLLPALHGPIAAAAPVDFEQVSQIARVQSRQPFQGPADDLPAALKALDYDAYRAIDYKNNQTIWTYDRALFRTQFFHRGYLHRGRVEIFLVEGGRINAARFHAGLFEYSRGRPEGVDADLGFAGFRLSFPLEEPDRFQEVISFLGASYFRAVGRGGVYGASARGLSVDAALPDAPEEFPAFRTFWIERPQPGARTLTAYALLSGPSVTGAYQFDIQPGGRTTVEVRTRLFLRKPVRKLGLAPLTSMFLYGEDQTPGLATRDDRPEVHDSDGLLLCSGGEWLWRPLRNPRRHQLNSFRVQDVEGFGLLQRDRRPEHYRDPRTNMERRPDIWVEPMTPWGPGRIELLRLASNGEGMDNILAQYVPDALPAPGEPIDLRYRLHFDSTGRSLHPALKAVATRRTAAPAVALYEIEFAGDAGGNNPEPSVTVTGGTVRNITLERSPRANTWRLSFAASSAGEGAPVELQARLRDGKDVLSETWSDTWIP